MNAILRGLDYFTFCRPVLILTAWTVLLLGATRGMNPQLAWLLAGYTCLLGAAFIVNQLRDLAGDRINAKLPHLAQGVVSSGEARLMTGLLLTGALLFTLRAGLYHVLGLLVFLIITAWAYNFPPLRLKERLLLGPLALALAAALLFQQGSDFAGHAWLETLAMALSVLSISLLTEIPDCAGDRATGRRTLAVVAGDHFTLRLSTVLMAAAALLALMAGFHLLALPTLFSLLLQLRLALKRRVEVRAVNLAVRLSLLLLGLAVAVAFLWFGLLILTCYLLLRYYYRQRFRRRYPSFTE